MRFLVSVLFLGFCGFGSLAHAQYDESSPLSFYLSSNDPGCINIDSARAFTGFPTLSTGTVTQIRFYYSSKSADDVTQDSPYIETGFTADDEYGDITLSSPQSCGFPSGSKTYIRYGLIDANNNVLHFMGDSEYDEYSDSIDVQ